MKQAIVTFKGAAPYSASKVFDSEKGPKESHDDFEQRCCRERLHVDANGNGFIPPMAFKKMLDRAAQRFPTKKRGAATYTQNIVAGVLVLDGVALGVTRDTVKLEKLFVPSDGKPGGGKRVWKWFPVVHEWGGKVVFHILDETITKDVFEETVRQGFGFVGIGRFRPDRGGFYGRAQVEKVEWK